MKTLGLVMIGIGVLAIILSLLGVPGLGRGAVPIVGFVLVAGGWVLYRHNKKKELANRS
jgi:hypothetical protein